MQTRPSTFDLRLFIVSGILLIVVSLLWWNDSRQPNPIPLTPTLSGETEYCLTCHADLPQISASHPVEVFGCVSCHGGERLALDADLAHSAMRGGANPSALSVVETSCGGSNCHSGSEADDRHHIQRVMTSVQSTYAGAISNIRFTFGAQSDMTARFGIADVTDENTRTGITSLFAFDPTRESHPSIRKFGEECLTCHLHSEPREGEAYARETGCAACHSPALPLPSGEGWGESKRHTLTTAIPYTQCNTCHNRGNYDLRTMTFIERTDHATTRLQDYYQPIAQFTKCEYTLDCVDCHTRSEVMGDGDIHNDQASVEYVQCKTCHGTLEELPLTKTLTNPEDIAFTLAFLNPVVDLKLGDTILVTEKGEPLWNIRLLPSPLGEGLEVRDITYEMIGKATEQYFTFNPVMGTACEQKPDEQESHYCHECHAVEK
ncbi:MAG: multiheme c-type cytochrome [Anaerolineales bacterium]|nr:multiheme c-type cytochrome [Anaerolineales bacterium]